MHNTVRHAAEQESFEPLPPMGADYDEVVTISHVAHGRDGITLAYIGRHGDRRARQRSSRVVYDLFSMPLTLLGPALESYQQLLINHMK
jgi:hypothetical protein